MNRSRSIFLALSLALLLPLVGGVLWSDVTSRRSADEGEDSLYKYLAIFSEVLGLVRHNYVDETESAALLAGAMEGVTDALDPFSVWIPADAIVDYERSLRIGRSRTGLTVLRDRGIAFVLAVEEGSPGAAAGFEAGDILTEVGGQPTRELPAWKISGLLAGGEGEPVTCRILRQGDTDELELVAADYPAPRPRLDRVRGLPLLRVPSFGTETAEQVSELLTELRDAGEPKLLVDLRGVAGGDAQAGYDTAGRFASGELGRLGPDDAPVRRFEGGSEPEWRGEAVVLVDAGTQGAAEILAAVLQKRAEARLVGVGTFGWAGEREWIELEGGSRLHLTTAFYTGPDGAALSDGLAPDLLVDELGRRYSDRDRPLSELILERGIELLLGEEESESDSQVA